MQRTRAELKAFFKKGAIPTESNFGDFVDSAVIQEEDSLLKPANDPLTLRAVGAEERLLLFARSESGGDRTTWLWSQRPPGSSNPGLALGDGATVRLFLDSETGNLGVGTVQPADALEVAGAVRILSGSNPIRITGAWSGFSDGNAEKKNNAEISNDTGQHKALMIVGNASSGIRKVGIWNTLEVNTGGAGDWNKFVVNTTNFWGDGDTQYVTIGAGGASGIMAYNLHVPWYAPEKRASIRYGRSGGVGDGHYWDVGVRANNGFSFWNPTTNTVPIYLDSAGNVGVGTASPEGKLDVRGAIRAGNSDIYFTATNHGHSGIGNTAGFAAIENASNYGALMILGRTVSTNPLRRVVKLWDELTVNGPLITDQGHRILIGVNRAPKYGMDGIRGEPNLWLDAANRVMIKAGFGTSALDVAERFKTVGAAEPGDVLVWEAAEGAVRRCSEAGDRRVVGIASGEPGMILGLEEAEMPVALCGRLPCKVDADVAPIAVGDLLTTSPTPGHAQKALDPARAVGAIIGKALAPLASGRGEILVLVALQ